VYQKGRGNGEDEGQPPEPEQEQATGGILDKIGQATQQLSGLIGAPTTSPVEEKEETTREAFEDITEPEQSVEPQPVVEEPTEETDVDDTEKTETAEGGGLLSQVTSALGITQDQGEEGEEGEGGEEVVEEEVSDKEVSTEFATKNKETAIQTISSQLGVQAEDVILTSDASTQNGDVSITKDSLRVEGEKLISNKSLSAGEYVSQIAFVYPSVFDGIQLLSDADLLQNARVKISPGNENCKIVSQMTFVEYPKNKLYSIKAHTVMLQMNQAVPEGTEIVLNKELVFRVLSSKNKEITSFPVLEMGEIIEEEEDMEPVMEASVEETEPPPVTPDDEDEEFIEDLDEGELEEPRD